MKLDRERSNGTRFLRLSLVHIHPSISIREPLHDQALRLCLHVDRAPRSAESPQMKVFSTMRSHPNLHLTTANSTTSMRWSIFASELSRRVSRAYQKSTQTGAPHLT